MTGDQEHYGTSSSFSKDSAPDTMDGDQSPRDADSGQPILALVVGVICSGKTTYINKNFASADWNILDAGELFLQLNDGSWRDFGKLHEKMMTEMGMSIIEEAIKRRENLVVELLLDRPDHIQEIARGFDALGYLVQIHEIDCELETAVERNENREENSISAYFTEVYHINWLLEALAFAEGRIRVTVHEYPPGTAVPAEGKGG
ncbi:MAG: zeta toxin family protein [Magnetococcales bacterium]|nr:zeta toxin family protein [Magnetococcales bacterium]